MAPYNSASQRTQLIDPEILPCNVRNSENKSSKALDNGTNSEKATPASSAILNNEKPKMKGYKGIFGEYETELVWHNIIPITILNIVTILGIFYFPYFQCWKTVLWGFAVGTSAGFGVTAGVHRYYCHRSFRASIPVQILFIMLYSAAGHNPIFEWVRDHRVHHKYSETDADPHNSNRGFFFSHVGWLFLKKHPEVLRKGKQIDMSDIINDPIAQFHDRHFIILRIILCFLLPTMVPIYFWGEKWQYAIMSQCLARYCIVLHMTWSVNSAAHLFGSKPYDITINPRENRFVAFLSMGEGWHNFHHTFPWDYRASEHGAINITLHVLNIFQRLGFVYDAKTASNELVKKVQEKRGENALHGHQHHPMMEYQDELGY